VCEGEREKERKRERVERVDNGGMEGREVHTKKPF
jgi:hypothetical protein